MYRERMQTIRKGKENAERRENAHYRQERNRCIVFYNVWGCVPIVWEGVVLRVREREQRKVRVSGEVAHPENHK